MDDSKKNGIGGLNRLPPDGRDFKFHVVFGSLTPETLPTEDFMVATPLVIKNQVSAKNPFTSLCHAFAVTEVSEDQEQVELDPCYQAAKTYQKLGTITDDGSDLRTAMSIPVDVGSIEKSIAPYSVEKDDIKTISNYGNYDSGLDWVAKKHKKGSYFSVLGNPTLDIFDSIRSALYKNKDDKESITVGMIWSDDWSYAPNGIIPKVYADGVSGHAFKIFGQKTITINQIPEIYLVAQLSGGANFGDKGLMYFPREVINKEIRESFGAFSFKSMNRERAEYMHTNNISVMDNWLIASYKSLLALLADLLNLYKKKLNP